MDIKYSVTTVIKLKDSMDNALTNQYNNDMEKDSRTTEISANNVQKKIPGVPFKKGDDPRRNIAGRPVGTLSFATALRKESERQAGIIKNADGTEEHVTALELITRKLVELGKKGDMAAIKEIADRIDGKARQGIDLDMQAGITVAFDESFKNK